MRKGHPDDLDRYICRATGLMLLGQHMKPTAQLGYVHQSVYFRKADDEVLGEGILSNLCKTKRDDSCSLLTHYKAYMQVGLRIQPLDAQSSGSR